MSFHSDIGVFELRMYFNGDNLEDSIILQPSDIAGFPVSEIAEDGCTIRSRSPYGWMHDLFSRIAERTGRAVSGVLTFIPDDRRVAELERSAVARLMHADWDHFSIADNSDQVRAGVRPLPPAVETSEVYYDPNDPSWMVATGTRLTRGDLIEQPGLGVIDRACAAAREIIAGSGANPDYVGVQITIRSTAPLNRAGVGDSEDGSDS